MSKADLTGLETHLERLGAQLEALRTELQARPLRAPESRETPSFPAGSSVPMDAHREQVRRLKETTTNLEGLARECERLCRAELARVHGSGLWRIGRAYWALQRWLRRKRRRWATSPGAAPTPTAPSPEEGGVATGEPAAAVRGAKFDVVCFPIIDWAFRFQRPQQLMKRLGARGHRVVYLTQSFHGDGPPYTVRPVEDNVYEASLSGRPANICLDRLTPEAADELFTSLDALRRDLGLGATVALVQLPFWWPVAERAWREWAWPVVYDCMDHHAGFSTNRPEMVAQEEALMHGARLVCASSRALLEQAQKRNASTLALPNACDYEHFSAVPPPPRGQRPTIGYYGAIADWFDADLVTELATRRPDWDFVLVGSTFTADTSRLASLPNVSLPGEQPYTDLPQWVARFDALILPFKRIPLTQATNPVKVYDILAAGRPLISVPLPEMEAFAPHVRLASTPEEFENEITDALTEVEGDAVRDGRTFAAGNTWDQRVDTLLDGFREAFPLVSIVIVTYNNLDLNRQCLESVFGQTQWPHFEVIVVDNASEDGTPGYLGEVQQHFSTLHVVLNDKNEGFAAANNIGLARASGEICVLLSNDTVVPRGWLSALVRHVHRDHRIGLLGPVSNAVGNEAEIPVGYRAVEDMPAWVAHYVREHDGESFEIPMLGMFCVAFRREVFEQVGTLDEQLEVGMFEGEDYARRVREAGLKVVCVRDAFVHRWRRASFKLLGERRCLKAYYNIRHRFEKKWGKDSRGLSLSRTTKPEIRPLLEAADRTRGTVIFPPSVGWSIQLFQRPHHLARAFAAAGYAVVFDCSNAPDNVKQLREIEPDLFLFRGALEELYPLRNPIIWTFPYNAHMGFEFPGGARIVYDWIDDLSVFSAWDSTLVRLNHERALDRATVVTTVARSLHAEALKARPDAIYLPNAVDYEHFAGTPTRAADPKLAAARAKRQSVAGYYGALAKWLDHDMLDEAAALRPDWTFVLVGPNHEGGLNGERLLRRPNVIWTGPRNYRTLPGYAAWFDVAMIPFRINAISQATSPLKLYEYFAAGKPVVATPMPECEAFSEVRIVRNAAELCEALDAAREDAANPEFVARMRALGRRNSWQARASQVLTHIDEIGDTDFGCRSNGGDNP